MSLRRLYRSVPKDERLCSYHGCQKSILRNIDEDDEGNLYHHGCLMDAKDETWRCLDCFTTFDGTHVTAIDFDGSRPTKCCGFCGSHNIKRINEAR